MGANECKFKLHAIHSGLSAWCGCAERLPGEGPGAVSVSSPPQAAPFDGREVDLSTCREPDESDYSDALEDALRFAGLDGLKRLDDASKRANEHSYEGSAYLTQDSIGVEGRVSLAGIRRERDYLSGDTAALLGAIDRDEDWRNVNYQTHSDYGSDHLTEAKCAFISVSLDAEEEALVAAVLEASGHDFAEDLVSGWRDVKAMQSTFGFSRPKEMHDVVSQTVKNTCPKAGAVLTLAQKLRHDACEQFKDESDYIGTDAWKADELEREANR
jgi:hypothetical protein